MKYIPVIGLEIHAQLLTDTKIFCSCLNKFGEEPNTLVCPICMGKSKTTLSANKQAVELAVKAGLVLSCKINNTSSFDRKNYSSPDLPKGYQLTQFYHPICENGIVDLKNKKIRIERIHLEEDAGKTINRNNFLLIDHNRCGVPLIEIVTAPDFRSADEVADFVHEISLRLKYADVCDAKLEQGSLRVDVNISVMEENSKTLGTRAEIKNLNSIKSIKQAISYEFNRQKDLIENGKKVECETRSYDEKTRKTFSMRKKESSEDYRYFPEPDIPTVYVSDDEILEIKNEIPKMPRELFYEYTNMYNLSKEDALLLIENKEISDFYQEIIKIYKSYNTIKNILLIEVNRNINKLGIDFSAIPFSPSDMAELSKLYDEKKITKQALCQIVKLMFSKNLSPTEIAREYKLLMEDDKKLVTKIIKKVIEENKDAVSQYKNGNQKAYTYLMGQVMRTVGKSANPETVTKLLKSHLDSILL